MEKVPKKTGEVIMRNMTAAALELRKLLDVSAGRAPADAYLAGGRLVNVLSGEIYPAGVAVCGTTIAYVGDSRAMVGPRTRVIDAAGYYLCPGLIEPHYHPWLIYGPVALAETALARGITTMVCDDLFFFVLMGTPGLLRVIEALDHLPLQFLWLVRAMHQTADPREEAMFSLANLEGLFADQRVVKLAEVTRWPLIVAGDPALLAKISAAREHGIGLEGHTAGCTWDRLNVVAAAGAQSCHEAITVGEVAERVRLGFWTMLRHSSLRPDLSELIRAVTEMHLSTGRLLLTSDGCSPTFIAREGLLDGLIRRAVAAGVNPVTALQMATINPATYLGRDGELGAIAPGRRADILLLPDLAAFAPHLVLAGGQIAAVDGKPVEPLKSPDWRRLGLVTRLPDADRLDNPSLFGVPADEPAVFPVAEFVSAVITRRRDNLLRTAGGFLEREEGMLYCALVDREGEWLANGFVAGMGQPQGFASTFNTAYDLLVLGRDRPAMAKAAAAVAEMDGGIALVTEGRVSFRLPLELGGLMSDRPLAALTAETEELEDRARGFGYPFHDFLYSILFLVCDFLPGLRITLAGVLEVKSGEILVPSRRFPR